jgi:hypothetical protein
MEIISGLDLTDPAAPVVSFGSDDDDTDTQTITVSSNVAFRASLPTGSKFVLNTSDASLTRYANGSVGLADSPEGGLGTYTFTIAPIGANAFDHELTATVSLICTDLAVENTPGNITFTATQRNFAPIANVASQGNIIYFAGTEDDDPADPTTYDNNYLSLGTWGAEITAANYQSVVAAFKWGSVVGMDLNPAHDGVYNSNLTTTNNAVRFSPMPTSSSFSTYADIPYAGDADGKTIDPTNYANTAAGKGDPCKLIGLTVAQLRGIANDGDLTALLNGRPADYTNWVMPTQPQISQFVDASADTSSESYGANVIKSSGTWSTAALGYVTFVQGDNAILPAAGRRTTFGAVDYQGTLGIYWSASPDSTYAYNLGFSSSQVLPASHNARSVGFAVRCVRTVTPEETPIDTASQGNIIYFAGTEDDTPADPSTYENNFLSLGTWGAEITAANLYSTIAYFKWGSVVGFDNATAHTVFNSDFSAADNAVKFSPMPTSSSFSAYADIPYAGDADGKTIDPTNYANTAAGKGDPCKLIGLTVAQLRGITSDADLTALLNGRGDDYKNWRLPTMTENCQFTDGTTDTSFESYGANVIKSAGTWSAAAPGYVTFVQSDNAILPAVGNRLTSGAVSNQGTYGSYWLASPSSTNAYYLYFSSTFVSPANINGRSLGFAVRCVRP